VCPLRHGWQGGIDIIEKRVEGYEKECDIITGLLGMFVERGRVKGDGVTVGLTTVVFFVFM
jgi:hypothetical protein